MPLSDPVLLDGATVMQWSGIEMAIGGGHLGIDEHTEYSGEWERAPIIWHDDSVPYAQFSPLDLLLATGKMYRIDSECNGGGYSLMMYEIPELMTRQKYCCGSPFRYVNRIGLPTGEARIILMRRDDQGDVVEIVLMIGSSTVRLLSGEVQERAGKRFRIVERDESVLVQLNGTRPTTGCGNMRSR